VHAAGYDPRMLKNQESRDAWLFWIVAVLVLGAGLGLRDPWPADEPRFALVARQMVESGQWLFPMRGNELYPDKPPLFMWIQATFLLLTGSMRIAFLLPSLLAALGTLWLVRDLGRRLWTAEAGTYAAWGLLFALQFTFQAKRAQIDPLVTFFITLSVYALLRHLLRGPDWRMWALGWFAAGLGVISKGVGVIALLLLLPAVWAQWRSWPGLTRLRAGELKFWLGPLALLLPVAAWLLPMLLTVQASADPALHAYADNILLRQTAGRYANPTHHYQPPWYFPLVMLTQWLPVMLALPWALKPWRAALRERDARVLLPLAWVALVVLFFSLSAGKREVYILPALPMLCLALGPWLPAILSRPWPRRLAFGFAAILSAVTLVAGLMVVLGEPRFEARLADARGIAGGGDALGAMLAAIGAFGVGALMWFRPRGGVAALLATLAGLWVGYGLIGYPLLNDASSARALMVRTGERIGPGAELGLVAWKEQNLLMAGRPARTFGFRRAPAEQLRDARIWQAQAPATRWLQIGGDAMDDCIDRSNAINLGVSNRREWWLVPAAAMVAGCVPVRSQAMGAEPADAAAESP
jgi:4-amino-4-deoxy-L-arabinose transferase-like glycosyltransferase